MGQADLGRGLVEDPADLGRDHPPVLGIGDVRSAGLEVAQPRGKVRMPLDGDLQAPLPQEAVHGGGDD
ncbi:hypothetical protein ACFQ8K_41095, partial [Streptomyces erythrochromogenes]|uniref:hypothetical protein n=1 Tax=Streptomyces erythrochromogenes TaxID=285574 RepID=UPI0036AF046D